MMNLSSDSDTDDSEHELGYYVKNKVKLMKEVLKLIKPKKIKSMAPDCLKDLNIAEINSMLLEELLGISNKRLNYIFKGENVDRESSSSDSDAEKDVIDVISLDDISDDDITLCIPASEINLLPDHSEKSKRKHSIKIKTEKRDKLNKDKNKKNKKSNVNKEPANSSKRTNKDQLMSVLEILELQARARAIRSQLALEHENKTGESSTNTKVKNEHNSDSDEAVIIESPQHKEIVITSDSDDSSRLTKKSSQTDGLLSLNISPKIIESQQHKIRVLVNDVESSITENKEKDLEVVVVEDSSQTASVSNSNLENEDTNKETGNPDRVDCDKSTSTAEKRKLEKTSLSKQKIKLVRNKVVKNKLEDNVKSTDNVVTIDCSDNDTENENISKTFGGVVIKVESHVTKQNAESNSDDIDEIVINLDEDEMDGIDCG